MMSTLLIQIKLLYGQTWAEQHAQYTVQDQPGRKQLYHCYQEKILTLKKGSLGTFYYIVETLVTKLHFCIFSTERQDHHGY